MADVDKKMKPLVLVMCLSVMSLHGAPDPITNLAEELSANPKWENGAHRAILLPKTASPKTVVADFFAKTTDRQGKIQDFEIFEERTVRISGSLPDTYLAVWCGTEFGGRIILMKYISEQYGWWAKSYESRYYTQERK